MKLAEKHIGDLFARWKNLLFRMRIIHEQSKHIAVKMLLREMYETNARAYNIFAELWCLPAGVEKLSIPRGYKIYENNFRAILEEMQIMKITIKNNLKDGLVTGDDEYERLQDLYNFLDKQMEDNGDMLCIINITPGMTLEYDDKGY